MVLLHFCARSPCRARTKACATVAHVSRFWVISREQGKRVVWAKEAVEELEKASAEFASPENLDAEDMDGEDAAVDALVAGVTKGAKGGGNPAEVIWDHALRPRVNAQERQSQMDLDAGIAVSLADADAQARIAAKQVGVQTGLGLGKQPRVDFPPRPLFGQALPSPAKGGGAPPPQAGGVQPPQVAADTSSSAGASVAQSPGLALQ